MSKHGVVVQMAAWASRRMRTRNAKLVAPGVGFELPAGDGLELKLAKLGDPPRSTPLANVALVDTQGLSGGNLSSEMFDDFRVGHALHYRHADIGMAINSSNDRCNIRKMEAIGDRIRRLRLAAGMTQIDFAKAVGLSQGVVSNIENGAGFEASTLMAMSKTLLRSPQYLMTGIEEAVELSDVEAKMIAAFRQAQPKAETKKPILRRTGEATSVPSPMSRAKPKRRAG